MKFPITKIEAFKCDNILVEYSDNMTDKGLVSISAWANGEGITVTLKDCRNIGQKSMLLKRV